MADVELVSALEALKTPCYFPVQITSSAVSPGTDINLTSSRYVQVTTAGSAGAEFVNLPNFDGEFTGYASQYAGVQLVIALAVQTDPGDTVEIKVAGASGCGTWERVANDTCKYATAASIVLGSVGAVVVLRWITDQWVLMVADSDFDSTVVYTPTPVILRTDDGADGTGGVNLAVSVIAGSNSADTGGPINVTTGSSSGGDGDGGDLTVTLGTKNGTGRDGQAFLNFPTADPHVVGAAYWNSNVLTRSTG
jgi:hypothetical protein